MPRSDKYVRIDKHKMYHVIALVISSGQNNVAIKKARLMAIAELLDLTLDEDLIDQEVTILNQNGINKNGGMR